jgi:hypothetical protein
VPDIIWASPPCTGFSVAAIGKNWVKGKEFEPKTDSARLGIALLEVTLELIEYYQSINPDLIWYIENPRGKMRKCPKLANFTRHTITYCQYGDKRMKPTDIWTNNEDWIPRPMCKNGDSCHVSAPRGSQTGTQGLKGNYERSKIPYELCKEVLTQVADAEWNDVCDECEDGEAWVDTSHMCGKYPIGECCGGCGHHVKCEECDGTGIKLYNF